LIPEHLWNIRMVSYWYETIKMDINNNTQYLKNFKVETIQNLMFERSKESIEIDEKMTEIDGLLTVIFTNKVDEDTVGFRCRELVKIFQSGSRFEKDVPNKHQLCESIYSQSTWKNVEKIRLEPVDSRNETWNFSFVIKKKGLRNPGNNCPRFFRVPNELWKDEHAEEFVKELNLRHTVVNGVDEFSV